MHYGEGLTMMQSIADSQGVSRKYLDTIFTSLKAAGMVRSRRGIGGGHMLAIAPEKIKLSEILHALEGPLSLVDCVGMPEICTRSHRCVTRDVWSEVGQAIQDVLENITLAELVQRHYRRNGKPGAPADEKAEGKANCTIDRDSPDLKKYSS